LNTQQIHPKTWKIADNTPCAGHRFSAFADPIAPVLAVSIFLKFFADAADLATIEGFFSIVGNAPRANRLPVNSCAGSSSGSRIPTLAAQGMDVRLVVSGFSTISCACGLHHLCSRMKLPWSSILYWRWRVLQTTHLPFFCYDHAANLLNQLCHAWSLYMRRGSDSISGPATGASHNRTAFQDIEFRIVVIAVCLNLLTFRPVLQVSLVRHSHGDSWCHHTPTFGSEPRGASSLLCIESSGIFPFPAFFQSFAEFPPELRPELPPELR